MGLLDIYLVGVVVVLLWHGWDSRGTFDADLGHSALVAALWPAAVIMALSWTVGSYFPRRDG